MPRFFGKSEIALIIITVIFQIAALFSLFRVAAGSATENPQKGTAIAIPGSLNQNISIPTSTPQFVNPAGSGLTASILLSLLFIVANIVVISLLAFLYRKRKMKLFSVLISLFLIFNVTELYFSFLVGLYSIVPMVAAIIATIVTLFAAFSGNLKVINALAILLALELGSSFPVLLQAPLNWIIPAAYALFDIYSIYYGKLGKLVTQVGKEQPAISDSSKAESRGLSKFPDFGLLTINIRSIEIGMADIAFYTMVPAVALILVNFLSFIIVMITVDVGIVLSFYAFRNKEVAPGLPIPILMGLVSLFLMFILV
ncbi:MAG: hypothetical protein JRN52_10910 [Nitrososphaerota archaeon]|nr:hypothetical protein [Nitrososphaerota archaeon]